MKNWPKSYTIIISASTLLLIFGNIFRAIGKNKNGLSGFSVFSTLKASGDSMFSFDVTSIAFLVQWVMVISIVITLYIRFIKKRKIQEEEIKIISYLTKKKENETDLDVLYNILKEKKELRASIIAGVFKIPNDKAVEWGKILEEKSLVEIDYPTFSEPRIIFKDNEKEEVN